MINLVLLLLSLPQMDTVERARILAEKGQITQAISLLESKGREEPSGAASGCYAQTVSPTWLTDAPECGEMLRPSR